ncbi:alanine racemase [Paenibacillus daejeonensis]|uniref:alanine racemase n=1 Tax=Paenibacillus daejeonensis TaxID=135193 RepID=UPI00036B7CA9|nr:alanine racemase [Paenibacillus daejeonensis]
MAREAYADLSTPAVIIDLDIMEANIAAMAQRLRSSGIQHRPHSKSHKSAAVARRQLAAGAVGITTAKLSEAEALAAAGIHKLLIAYPIVGEDKLRRLAALHQQAELIVTVDSLIAAEGLARVGRESGRPLRVLVEIDGGLHRGGRQPGDDTVSFARLVSDMQGLELCGLMGYFGAIYRESSEQGFRSAVQREAQCMREMAASLRAAGLPAEIISTGSSPSGLYCEELTGVTEVRAGNYVFFDASGVAMGLAREEDCALRVIATVVSTPMPGYATIDAGTKTLTSDKAHHREGFGMIVGQPDLRIESLNEEHGFVRYPPNQAELKVGDRMEIIPNHACVLPNLCDRVAGVRQGKLEEWIVIDARGCVD